MLRELAPELENGGTLNCKKVPSLKNAILIDDIHKKGFLNFKDLFAMYGGSHI